MFVALVTPAERLVTRSAWFEREKRCEARSIVSDRGPFHMGAKPHGQPFGDASTICRTVTTELPSREQTRGTLEMMRRELTALQRTKNRYRREVEEQCLGDGLVGG